MGFRVLAHLAPCCTPSRRMRQLQQGCVNGAVRRSDDGLLCVPSSRHGTSVGLEAKQVSARTSLLSLSMRPWLGIGALIVLSSCSHDDSSDSSYHRVIGAGLTVAVTNVRSQEDAAPMASKYCSQLGREARFKGMTLVRSGRVRSQTAQFDCVSGSG